MHVELMCRRNGWNFHIALLPLTRIIDGVPSKCNSKLINFFSLSFFSFINKRSFLFEEGEKKILERKI